MFLVVCFAWTILKCKKIFHERNLKLVICDIFHLFAIQTIQIISFLENKILIWNKPIFPLIQIEKLHCQTKWLHCNLLLLLLLFTLCLYFNEHIDMILNLIWKIRLLCVKILSTHPMRQNKAKDLRKGALKKSNTSLLGFIGGRGCSCAVTFLPFASVISAMMSLAAKYLSITIR